MTVMRAIEPLVHHPRDMGELAQIVLAQAGFKAHLEYQAGQQADQIGVAAALTQAVQGALDLAHAGAHRRQTVGHRVAGVVVAVDAQSLAGEPRRDRRNDILHLMGQRAAVGIAQHRPA